MSFDELELVGKTLLHHLQNGTYSELCNSVCVVVQHFLSTNSVIKHDASCILVSLRVERDASKGPLPKNEYILFNWHRGTGSHTTNKHLHIIECI